jgi:hypothetical protein
MSDFRIYRRSQKSAFRLGRVPWTGPFFKRGNCPLPFTLENRHYIYVGPLAVEWFTGTTDLTPGIFAD